MAEAYHDRKMLKWLPFQALPEQGGYLHNVFNQLEKETMPELSDDQLAWLNYRFNEAFAGQEEVVITYFDEGKRLKYKGVIQGFDPVFKVFMLGQQTLQMKYVIDVSE